ncbi:hypothetical protein ACNHKD_15250 [Methylocystis sp. JAN1]
MILPPIANVQLVVDLLHDTLWEASNALIVAGVLFFVAVFGFLILGKG